MRKTIEDALTKDYPADIVEALLDSYIALQEAYLLHRWKPSELEAGFFVEAARRIVELSLFNSTQPIGKQLPQFTDDQMKRYETGMGNESFRVHIPRTLRSIYNFRNKRGVAHLSAVNPNYMDATYILAACSWVLAEIVRLGTGLPAAECQQVIDSLVQRPVPLVFEDGEIKRVLDAGMLARDQVLVLLCTHSEPIDIDALRGWIEYKNPTNFRNKVLKPMYNSRLLEVRDGICKLTPAGMRVAHKVIAARLQF